MTTSAAIEIPGYVEGSFTIDPVHSYVGFVVRHLMVSKVRGSFSGVAGTITTAADPSKPTVDVIIDAATLTTGNETRDQHVVSGDFLAVDSHPEITFKARELAEGAEGLVLHGVLTIRGISRGVALQVDNLQFGSHFDGKPMIGASASVEINRHDFGVDFNGPVPGGGVVLSEKVTIVLDIEATQAA